MFYSLLVVLLACAAFSAEVGHRRCPPRDGAYPVYIPHRDCTKFYECSNGTPYLFDCPAGLHFNPRKNVCDWPWRAGCRTANN
ncbi:hypothetical protein MTP99_012090 [Tenebrio molitor]|nr:hypothetical protein MTP99_012090 [Tenebrio molitor]CAH1370514.1 unnamed protein product [Tenebrio molitor]